MMQTSRSNVKTPGNSSSHHESKKEILAEATPRANNKATPPRKAVAQKPPSSPLIPHHHQSRKASDLHVNEAGDVPEDRRISALTERGQIESSVSTSAPNGRRKLKTHVGPWHLGPTLGTGATGKVRKARHTGTGQLAAVKVVSRRNATDLRSHSVMQMDRKRAKTPLQIHRRVLPFGIEREIVIMKIIEHPNVIKLYDVWENCGELYVRPLNSLHLVYSLSLVISFLNTSKPASFLTILFRASTWKRTRQFESSARSSAPLATATSFIYVIGTSNLKTFFWMQWATSSLLTLAWLLVSTVMA